MLSFEPLLRLLYTHDNMNWMLGKSLLRYQVHTTVYVDENGLEKKMSKEKVKKEMRTEYNRKLTLKR